MPYIVRPPRRRAWLAPAVTVAAISLAAAGAASAAAPASSQVCVPPAFSQVFLPWKDTAQYTKSPGGDLEGVVRDWSFTAGAAVVDGNEPFFVGDRADRRSLLLPSGAGAVSAPMCIDGTYPSFRFFARSVAGGKGDLSVEVLFQESGVRHVQKAELDKKAGTAWTPVKSLKLPSDALTGGLEPVTFRFHATGGGAWQVDDLYVDPYMRR